MKHIPTTENLFPSHSRETRLPKQEEETQNEQASILAGFIPSALGLWVECSTTVLLGYNQLLEMILNQNTS